jgi:hypothetical protein
MWELLLGWIGVGLYTASVFGAIAAGMRVERQPQPQPARARLRA